ncbi:hypothetical protein [Leifsonia sp. AG29]|uniref:hypothetical protein n=1 Tax=Leifsonia sp. AG29 TaxID=2598860 RepID=UPI00131CB4C6|nr:hypothetical protein [Leifsonia sp. AG29]
MTTLPLPAVLGALLPISLWAMTPVVSIASLCCIVATLRSPRRPLVYVATGLLALAIVLVLLTPHPAPPVFRVLIGIVALALAVLGGGPASQLVLVLATRSTTQPGINGGIVVHEMTAQGETAREVLRGGTTIGLLERLAAAASIMAGFPEALAVLVAIKGVGRFTELVEGQARERFIIGTLTSLIWACACAGLYRIAAG